MSETKIYDHDAFQHGYIEQTLQEVVSILKERGYNPIHQIVGYLLSGDPGYITSYKDARKKITQFDRTQILEVLVQDFLQ